MPTVRVTCPECEHPFNIADTRVGGLVTCRDCRAEFRVEFAEDDAAAERDDRPTPRPKATRTRADVDQEPEAWKTDLPLRSPVPLLLVLTGLQVIVALFLVFNWFVPVASQSAQPTRSYYYNSPQTAPDATTVTASSPTRKW